MILETGRYTMILINTMGFSIARKINLYELELEKNNWNDESLKVIYSEKGKSKKVGFRIKDEITFLKGWYDIRGCFNTQKGSFEAVSCAHTVKDILNLNNIEENNIAYSFN